MASVSQRRPRRQGSYESQNVRSYRPKPRRWLKRIVVSTTLLAIFVLVLPTIVSYTGLRNAPLRMALDGMRGTVQAGSASLSWFAPIQYSDIEIRNERGELLLALPKVESDRSLLGLLANLNDLGTIRIQRPQVTLAMRRDGSNAEDVLAPVFKDAQSSATPSKPPAVTVEIVDGGIELADSAAGQKWKIEKLNLKLRMSPESTLPAEVTLSAQVPYEGRTAQLTIASVAAASGAPDHVEAKVDSLPLAMLRSLVDRFAPGVKLAGTISSNLRCDAAGGNPDGRLQVSGLVAVDGLAASGGVLGNDRLALQRVELPCRLAYQNHQLDIEQLALVCDVGQLSVTGNVAMPEKIETDAVSRLARSAINVEGQLDLVKLAALLPGTLHVRSGTQITNGQVRLALASKPEVAAHVWTGQLGISNLAAVHEGRKLAWEQPINILLAARQQAGNYSVDQLNCTSNFLTVSGRGSIDQFQAEASCDLDRLMSELSQFIDLGEVRLAGQGTARVNWEHAMGGRFQTNTEVRLQGLQIMLPGKPAWQEDSVVASGAASGLIENLTLAALSSAKLQRLDAAQLSAAVDNAAARTHEQIEVQLRQPIDGLSGNGAAGSGQGNQTRLPIAAHLQGQLGRWWPRIAGWLGVEQLDLGGACDITVQAACSKSGIEIQQLKATVNALHAWGWNTVFIDEPVVQLEASGGYDFAAGRLTLNRTSLLTSSLSLQTEAATIVMPTWGPFGIQGNFAYQADLARVLPWLNDPRSPPKYALAGLLMGNLNVTRTGLATNAKFDAAVDKFAMYVFDEPAKARTGVRGNANRVPEPVWQEQRLTLAASGGLDNAADAIQLTTLDIGSQALQLHAAGKIDSLSKEQNVNLAGNINYDWQSLGPLLKPYLGNGVQIAGRQSRKFSVRGTLGSSNKNVSLASTSSNPSAADTFACLRPLVAEVSLGWTAAEIYGLRVGQVDLDAHLENGSVAFKPIETTLTDDRSRSSGRLTIKPAARLSPNPSEFTLDKGPLLSDVQITQALSNAWLKFVAPIMADATRTEGTLSIELDGARVPLDDPAKADLGGRLLVQNVAITPGPLARPLVLIGQQIEAIIKKRPPPVDLGRDPVLLTIDNQKVDFRMVDGRVFHQGLVMQVGEVTIRTRGWVGVDESLGLVAEVPLKPEWMRNPIFAGMREQTIQIPISGSLKNPKVDSRVLEQLLGQALQNTARGVIENELNKQLDRLFTPPQR